MNIFKKHIIFLCLVVLHIPTVIQTIHIFENHDHFVCTSDIESHFHEIDDIDCSLFHYQFKMYSSVLKNTYITLPIHSYTNLFNKQPQFFGDVYFTKQSNRGPPLA